MVRMFLILVLGLLPPGACLCHAGEAGTNLLPLSCPADSGHSSHIAGCPAVTAITGDTVMKPATDRLPILPALAASATPPETLSQFSDLPFAKRSTFRHPLYLTLRTLII